MIDRIMRAPESKRIFLIFCIVLVLMNACPSVWADTKRGGLKLSPLLLYSSESGFGGGAALSYLYPSQKGVRVNGLLLGAFMLYSRDEQFSGELKWEQLWRERSYASSVDLYGGKYRERFYGIGSNTSPGAGETYTNQSIATKLVLRRIFTSDLSLGIGYELGSSEISDVREGGLLDRTQLLGAEGGVDSGLGMFLLFDSRDNRYYPLSGWLSLFSIWGYSCVLGGDYVYSRFAVDVRKYVSTFPSHVIALQGHMRLMSGDVPFTRLSLLGGSSLLRGYERGRYRDKAMLIFQTEYRMPLIWRLGTVLFANIGDVSEDITGFRLEEFKYSFGVGARLLLNNSERIHLRFDYAAGIDSSGFYIALTEAF